MSCIASKETTCISLASAMADSSAALLDEMRLEYIADRTQQLLVSDRIRLLIGSGQEGIDALSAVADADGSLDLFEARAGLVDILTRQAVEIARSEWTEMTSASASSYAGMRFRAELGL